MLRANALTAAKHSSRLATRVKQRNASQRNATQLECACAFALECRVCAVGVRSLRRQDSNRQTQLALKLALAPSSKQQTNPTQPNQTKSTQTNQINPATDDTHTRRSTSSIRVQLHFRFRFRSTSGSAGLSQAPSSSASRKRAAAVRAATVRSAARAAAAAAAALASSGRRTNYATRWPQAW